MAALQAAVIIASFLAWDTQQQQLAFAEAASLLESSAYNMAAQQVVVLHVIARSLLEHPPQTPPMLATGNTESVHGKTGIAMEWLQIAY